MNSFRALFRPLLPALLAAAMLGATPAMADDLGEPMMFAGADCYGIGQQIAAQSGGTLAKASQADRGGQPVCVIVVLVPGKEGERPRREEYVVPAS